MLDFVPSIRKLPNTRYCCRNLEFFHNPNVSNIRQLFSAENTAENVFIVTLMTVIDTNPEKFRFCTSPRKSRYAVS